MTSFPKFHNFVGSRRWYQTASLGARTTLQHSLQHSLKCLIATWYLFRLNHVVVGITWCVLYFLRDRVPSILWRVPSILGRRKKKSKKHHTVIVSSIIWSFFEFFFCTLSFLVSFTWPIKRVLEDRVMTTREGKKKHFTIFLFLCCQEENCTKKIAR